MRRTLPLLIAALLLIVDLGYMGFLAFGHSVEKYGTGKAALSPTVTVIETTLRTYQRAVTAENKSAAILPITTESINTVNYLEGYSICKNPDDGKFAAEGRVEGLPGKITDSELTAKLRATPVVLPAGYSVKIKLTGEQRDRAQVNILKNGKPVAVVLNMNSSQSGAINFNGYAIDCINLDNLPKTEAAR